MVFSRRCFKNIHPILNALVLNIDAHFTFLDDDFGREHETRKFRESPPWPGAPPLKLDYNPPTLRVQALVVT